jgi:hypothetical protein
MPYTVLLLKEAVKDIEAIYRSPVAPTLTTPVVRRFYRATRVLEIYEGTIDLSLS